MTDSTADTLALQHLFVLCCYGGVPFINYFSTSSNDAARRQHVAALRMIDPTDWMASDMSGSLLNATLHPKFVARHPQLVALVPRVDSSIELDACDLYNLTFSSAADENLFYRFHGVFACRCSLGRFGHSCEYSEDAQVNRDSTGRLRSITTTTTTTARALMPTDDTVKIIESKRETTMTTTVTEKIETTTRNRTTRTLSPAEQLVASTLYNGDKIGRRVTRKLPYVPPTVLTSILQSAKMLFVRETKTTSNASQASRNLMFAPRLSTLDLATASSLNCSLIDCTTEVPMTNMTIATAMSLVADDVVSSRWTLSTYLLVILVLMLALVGSFRLMRGCFCDCFGGFKNPFAVSERYDAPVDVNALHRCLDAVNAYEQSEKNKYLAETRRPLISSISEMCPPYNPTVISAHNTSIGGTTQCGELAFPLPRQQQKRTSEKHWSTVPSRTHSPPPSYHSSIGSLNAR